MRKVLIGTPSYSGELGIHYVNSLINTLRQAPQGLAIDYLFLAQDALVQRARNDIFVTAMKGEVDDLVFIDSDVAWSPEWFYAILKHDVDVVGIPVPKKNDVEQYSVKCLKEPKLLENGLIKIDGMATGFLRVSKKAMQHAWDRATPYKENGIDKRMVFDVRVIDGELYSEDIYFCESLGELGVYLDPRFTCAHVGSKIYGGKFDVWLANYVKFLQAEKLKVQNKEA